MKRHRLAIAVVLTIVACHRATPRPRSSILSLPDHLAGFDASPATTGDTFVRRTYSRAATRIDVTLAHAPQAPGSYDAWQEMSRVGFPQASLDAPADDANGFYQCTAGTPERPESCDLLIHMRSGFHLEIRGGGTSTRADVDALAHALPLRALAAK